MYTGWLIEALRKGSLSRDEIWTTARFCLDPGEIEEVSLGRPETCKKWDMIARIALGPKRAISWF